jgi:hypothetical protein
MFVRERGRWNASVLAQKAQAGKLVPLSCTSHMNSAAQVVGGRVPRKQERRKKVVEARVKAEKQVRRMQPLHTP